MTYGHIFMMPLQPFPVIFLCQTLALAREQLSIFWASLAFDPCVCNTVYHFLLLSPLTVSYTKAGTDTTQILVENV